MLASLPASMSTAAVHGGGATAPKTTACSHLLECKEQQPKALDDVRQYRRQVFSETPEATRREGTLRVKPTNNGVDEKRPERPCESQSGP